MIRTLTVLGNVAEQMTAHFAQARPNEAAGYLFVRESRTAGEIRLIGREFWPVTGEDLLVQTPTRLSIRSLSYVRAFQHAEQTKQGFWFVHSHPENCTEFSGADDATEPALFASAYIRIEGAIPHGSLVFPERGAPFGRMWLGDGTTQLLDRIRLIGRRWRFYDRADGDETIPEFFNRQVRAFGPDMQKLLGKLHIGVVGCGGTGSAVCQQLIRLGVGRISVFDGQRFERSNVNRVYGSLLSDDGAWKVGIVEREAASIGLKTVIHRYPGSIYREQVARRLAEVDIIFGCTDDEYGRSILNEVALRYAIPLLDMGVKISSEHQKIESVIGRVTTVQPGHACLHCRGRITSKGIAADAFRAAQPAAADALAAEGYAPELGDPAPAVISFTTPVASMAVNEMLHRLTGFMGEDRETTEVIQFFDRGDIGHNATPADAGCKCSAPKVVGSGDQTSFLGLVWTL